MLDGFRYGSVSHFDTDSKKPHIALSSCDSATEPNRPCSDPDSPERLTDEATVKKEIVAEPSDKNHMSQEPRLQPEQSTYKQPRSASPDAKRARKEDPGLPTELRPSSVDAPVCLQRRAVPLQFSLPELAAKMRRIQEQKRQRANGELCYRRFRAKINPGENHSAEEELKKEIR